MTPYTRRSDVPTASNLGPPLSFPEAEVGCSHIWWTLSLTKCLELSPLSPEFFSTTPGACSDYIQGSPKDQRISHFQEWPSKIWDWILWINRPNLHPPLGGVWGSLGDWGAHSGKPLLDTPFIESFSFPVWVGSRAAWAPWDHFLNKLLSTDPLSWGLLLGQPKMRPLLPELGWW